MSKILALPLPSTLDGWNMRTFALLFMNACGDGLPQELYFDFAPLRWIDPVGVTFLSNFCQWLSSRFIKAYFLNHDKASPPLRFLDDSLFFEQHVGVKVNMAASPRSTTRHLQRVGHSESHAWVRMNLLPWLVGSTGKSAASFYPITVCVSEIFNNIQDHTDIPNGSIFIQQFPRKNTISISIADFGVGIPERVRTLRPMLNDHEAILAAVEPGFTTKTTPRNRGAGLDYLLQTVCAARAGQVWIYSHGGYAVFYPIAGGVGRTTYPTINGFCPGTTIEVRIRTDALPDVEDTSEDLTW